MEIEREMFCKLFVDTDLDKDRLMTLVTKIVGGVTDSRTVVSADCELDVIRNKEFDAARTMGHDGFLFYRYYFDIEPAADASRERYIACIARLLNGLWRSDCRAVAACHFESELPRHGGLADPAPVKK